MGGGEGRRVMTNLKKTWSIGSDWSLSEGTGRSGFLIKYWLWRSVFKGKSFSRKRFYVVDINNHSKTSVSFSLYLIQHNKADSYIRNWTLYHVTTKRCQTSALELICLINAQPYFYKKLSSPVNKTLKKRITVTKQLNYLNHSSVLI